MKAGLHPCPVGDCTHSYSRKTKLFEHLTSHDTPPPSGQCMPSGDDVLLRIGCTINRLHSLIVCDSCRHALEPAKLVAHMDGKHGQVLTDSDVAALLRDFDPVDRKSFVARCVGTIEQVPGIDLVSNGCYCPVSSCLGAYSSKEVLRKHCSAEHGSSPKGFTRGPYQAVFGPFGSNTRVLLNVSLEESHLRIAAYMDSRPEPPRHPLGSLHPANLTPFLRATQWHVFLDSLGKGTPPVTPKLFRDLAHRDRRDLPEELTRFRKVLREYCEELAQGSKGIISLALQIVNTKK